MASEQRLQTRQPRPSAAEREQTIALLSDRFAHGELEMEEFEERVTLAHRAQAVDELAALLADLSPPLSEPPPTQVLDIATSAPDRGEAVAIFGGTRRVGAWNVPRHMHVTAIFGGVELDLRSARLPPGPIDVDVTAMFGGVHVVVPPSLAVEVQGTAIFGGFEQLHRTSSVPNPDLPVVRIHGRAIFGGVSVDTRLPGESSFQAHRRQRKEQRALRHARRPSE